MQSRCGYRVLPYIEDFLVALAPPGRAANEKDGRGARESLGKLFGELGIVRHPTKGCQEGGRQIDHLGMHVNTEMMHVYVSNAKMQKVWSHASRFLERSRQSQIDNLTGATIGMASPSEVVRQIGITSASPPAIGIRGQPSSGV